MSLSAITDHLDFAQLLVVAFFIFFAGLILHLRAEDKREGYPLKDPAGGPDQVGFPEIPAAR
jgi:photosynthetic reaction center H subunit